MEQTDERFTPYPYLTKSPGSKDEVSIYLVYSGPKECKPVQAYSASEALRLSGIANPLKIIRYDPMSMSLLDRKKFQ